MDNSIAFIYNPQKYFQSYKNVLQNVRKHYLDNDIFIFFDEIRDDLNVYLKLSEEYNCKVLIRKNEVFFINRTDSIETNLPKMLEWIERIKISCENSKAEWILLLEDDVVIKRKIIRFPTAQCGTNRDYFRLGGGSIVKRKVLLNALINSDIENYIKKIPDASWAGDLLLENIFKDRNIGYEKWIELAEPGYYEDSDHAVFHGYKELHKLG